MDDTMREMSDVKELIWSDRRKDLKDEESRMNEWMQAVQDVVRMNAGWKCVMSLLGYVDICIDSLYTV